MRKAKLFKPRDSIKPSFPTSYNVRFKLKSKQVNAATKKVLPLSEKNPEKIIGAKYKTTTLVATISAIPINRNTNKASEIKTKWSLSNKYFPNLSEEKLNIEVKKPKESASKTPV